MNIDLGELIRRAGIDAREVVGLVATQRSIYAKRTFATSLLASDYRFFHVGIDDDVSNYGGSAGTLINIGDTNLNKGGAIPDGEIFVGMGMSIELPRTVVVADAEALLNSELRYEEANGKVKRILGEGVEFPPVYRADYHLIQDTTSTGAAAARENYRRLGPPNVGASPLFVLRGNAPEVKRGSIMLRPHAAATITATVVKLRVHGFWFQRTGANELATRG